MNQKTDEKINMYICRYCKKYISSFNCSCVNSQKCKEIWKNPNAQRKSKGEKMFIKNTRKEEKSTKCL